MDDLVNEKFPEYELQVSRRARRARIKVTPLGKVVVVIPAGLDPAIVPQFLAEKQHWLRQVLHRIATRQRHLPATHSMQPNRINLVALDEVWQVEYRENLPRRLTSSASNRRLQLNREIAATDNAGYLRQWLQQRARQVLPAWLQQTSEEVQLPFERVQIRGQKTRWGSCSSRRTISLNRNLLLLPASTVRYLLIHELCHTRHMNHSPRFWRLVSECMPDYQQHEKILRETTRQLPLWVYG